MASMNQYDTIFVDIQAQFGAARFDVSFERMKEWYAGSSALQILLASEQEKGAMM